MDTTSRSSAPVLGLALLGGVGVTLDGVPLPLPNRRARAILGYLALVGGEERRERLAGLFWGDVRETAARASLRQTLLELRRVLSGARCDALDGDRDVVRLSCAGLRLDTDELLRAAARRDGPEEPIAVPPAPLMAGHEDLGPLFREWLEARNAAFVAELGRLLEEGHEDTTLPPRRRRHLAEAALRLDPLNEGACRAVMRLAAEDGETGMALRAYAALYDALADEMDMEPAAATMELVAEIKQGRIGAAPAAAMTIPAAAVPAAPRPSAAMLAGVPVVAVLPLRVMGTNPAVANLAECVADDLVGVLACLREPVVISSSSTRGYTSGALDLAAVGRALGAQYIVSGSARAAASGARLSVELAEASSGAVLWFRTSEVEEASLEGAPERMAASIAHALVPRVREAEFGQSLRRPPHTLSAHHLVLRARDLIFRLERPALATAAGLLRRAMAADPGYAGARTALANLYSLKIGQGWSSSREADQASLEEAAREAIALDSADAHALALLGHSRTILARRHDEAIAMFERAQDAAPSDAEAWMWSAPTFAFIGEGDEALRRIERAMTLSPQDPLMFRYEHFASIAHYARGDMEASASAGLSSHRRNPLYTSNLRGTAAPLAALGRLAEARELADRVLALEPGFTLAGLARRLPYADVAVAASYVRHLSLAGFPD